MPLSEFLFDTVVYFTGFLAVIRFPGHFYRWFTVMREIRRIRSMAPK